MEIISDTHNVIPEQPVPINKDNFDATNSSNKKKKSKKLVPVKILTGHTSNPEDTSRVRSILLYDIPVNWTPEKILSELQLWGKPISIHCTPQKKYQTVKIIIELSTIKLSLFEGQHRSWTTNLGDIPVRWFPSRWTLKKRK